jgi:hypothetical protein
MKLLAKSLNVEAVWGISPHRVESNLVRRDDPRGVLY